MSPAFKGSTTKYTATVDNSVTSIAVSATPVNEKATIESVTGNTNLAVGANVVQIVVKAENGTTATYKITVTRQAAGTTGSETTTTGGENGDDGNVDSETPEDTEEVDTTETPVSAADAKAGDIIFFTGTYNAGRPVTHVGIYCGNGTMVHCGDPIQYTSINTSYWQSHFYGFGRLN